MDMTRGTVKDYLAGRKGLSRDEFVKKYPFPFLLEREHSGADSPLGSPTSTLVVSHDRIKAIMAGESAASSAATVLRIAARGGATPAPRVTVGRTPNNDISIESPAISKLHAVFTIDAAKGACALSDEGATNGTFVNGKRLQQGAATPLRDGDMVAFSQEYKFTYYTPGAFFDYLSVAERA